MRARDFLLKLRATPGMFASNKDERQRVIDDCVRPCVVERIVAPDDGRALMAYVLCEEVPRGTSVPWHFELDVVHDERRENRHAERFP